MPRLLQVVYCICHDDRLYRARREKMTIPDRPILKRHLSLCIVDPDELFLFGEAEPKLWKSRLLRQVLPLLDGSRSIGHLFEQLDGVVSPPEIMFALNQAHALG